MYRCKQLKRAALGRMATILRRQKEPLAYLEQVRQHLARLPSIDPTTRTLVICGYPNVGKSSFINKITRADVDVQPYAFTTKSLFVGHMDYKYLRWQVIDTPGILDHPLEEMNTIEMQSITALAHLRAAVLYFFDLSEQCGYSVDAQIKLYQSIKPLFANKTVICVMNKSDIIKLDQLPAEEQETIKKIRDVDGAQILESSCYTDDGIMNVRNTACDALLASRVDHKIKVNKVNSILNKIHVAQPTPRDQIDRVAVVPPGAAARAGLSRKDPLRRRTEKEVEEENGGPGVYSGDYQKTYLLAKDEWKYDEIPHVMDGKNVADFIDPDILERLEALEKEEEELEAKGYYDETEDVLDDEEAAERAMHERVKKARLQAILTGREKKRSRQNVAPLPRSVSSKSASGAKTYQDMIKEFRARGLDTAVLEDRARAALQAQRAQMQTDEAMDDVDDDDDDDAASINSEDFEDSDDGGSAMALDDAPKRPTTAKGLKKQIAFLRQNRGGDVKGRALAGVRDKAVSSERVFTYTRGLLITRRWPAKRKYLVTYLHVNAI